MGSAPGSAERAETVAPGAMAECVVEASGDAGGRCGLGRPPLGRTMRGICRGKGGTSGNDGAGEPTLTIIGEEAGPHRVPVPGPCARSPCVAGFRCGSCSSSMPDRESRAEAARAT